VASVERADRIEWMAEQRDVRRIALALPETEEDTDGFSFSVRNGKKRKGIAWVWLERIEPKKARVPNPGVIAIRVPNEAEKEMLTDAWRCQAPRSLVASFDRGDRSAPG
jgi:hypothetical protein